MVTDPGAAVDAVREALLMMLTIATPILFAGLAIGLAVSIVQAATQIQEQTLSFVPKMIAMGLVALMLAPWLIQQISDFAERMFAGY